MKRRDFLKVSAAELGTLLVSGTAWQPLTSETGPAPVAPVASAARLYLPPSSHRLPII